MLAFGLVSFLPHPLVSISLSVQTRPLPVAPRSMVIEPHAASLASHYPFLACQHQLCPCFRAFAYTVSSVSNAHPPYVPSICYFPHIFAQMVFLRGLSDNMNLTFTSLHFPAIPSSFYGIHRPPPPSTTSYYLTCYTCLSP